MYPGQASFSNIQPPPKGVLVDGLAVADADGSPARFWNPCLSHLISGKERKKLRPGNSGIAPIVGWVDHPLCSQRFIASMTGLPGSNIQQTLLLLRTAHLSAVMAVMRVLSSIAILEPIALVPYRTFFEGLLFSASLPAAAADSLCIVCIAIGKTCLDNVTYFVRVALTALKHGTPVTNGLMQLRQCVVSICSSVVSAFPTILRPADLEGAVADRPSAVLFRSLTPNDFVLPPLPELEGADLAPHLSFAQIANGDSVDAVEFDAVIVLQDLLDTVVAGKPMHSLPVELAIRDAMVEERLTTMQKMLEGGLMASCSEMVEMRTAIELIVGQVDAERVAHQSLADEVGQVKERVAEMAIDLAQVQSDVNELDAQQLQQEDVRELRGILESQLADLRKQVDEFVRRVPVPRRIVVRDANVLRVSVELHFSCDCSCNGRAGHGDDTAADFSDLRECCLFGDDAVPLFAVRTANWRKWIKVSMASLSLAVSLATASAAHAMTSIASIYQKLKAPSDGEFATMCRQLQENHGGALMTSVEQDELLESLRAAGFFQTFSWDPEMMQWCCASCRSHVPRILEREARSKMFVSLAEQLRALQVRHTALQLDLSTLDHRLPCEGSITKQGHKVKNWKQRVAHLDADHFWYATAVGQPPIRVVLSPPFLASRRMIIMPTRI
eukprot:ANDGO_07268.mRNA.1 hypothetical protein CAOG_05957